MTHLHEGKEPFGAFWTLRVWFQASCPKQNAGEGAGLRVRPPLSPNSSPLLSHGGLRGGWLGSFTPQTQLRGLGVRPLSSRRPPSALRCNSLLQRLICSPPRGLVGGGGVGSSPMFGEGARDRWGGCADGPTHAGRGGTRALS